MFGDSDLAILLHIADNFSTTAGGYAITLPSAAISPSTASPPTARSRPGRARTRFDAVRADGGIGFDKLREHLKPTYRGPPRHQRWAACSPTSFPTRRRSGGSSATPTCRDAKTTFDKLVKIADGAALMTGTEMSMEVVASAWPQLGNGVLSEAISRNVDLVGLPKWTPEEDRFAREFQKSLGLPVVGLRTERVQGNRPQSFASNDSGDVTWQFPAGTLSIPSAVPGVAPHNWQAGVTPTLSLSHKGQVVGAKVLAASILDMLTDPGLITKAKQEFEAVLQSRRTSRCYRPRPSRT